MLNKLLFLLMVFLTAEACLCLSYAQPPTADECERYRAESQSFWQQKSYTQAYRSLFIADSLAGIVHREEVQKLQNQCIELKKQNTEEVNNAIVADLKKRQVMQGIFVFILIDVLGLLFFMYLQKQRAYLHLVKKNLDWAHAGNMPSLLSARENIPDEQQEQDVDLKDNVSQFDIKDREILLNCIALFRKEKIYLKSEITIQEIAKLLNSNKTNISRLINSYYHKNFPTVVNEYRIKEAIHLLSDNKAGAYKLEVISEMCGFRNRQVFHQAFKRVTGMTPHDFRKTSFSRDFLDEYGDQLMPDNRN
jgi:YesN/AraC family two-component response regulator